MWKRILHTAHRFGFTRNEAAVIVFLSLIIAAGGVIEELRSSDRPPTRDLRASYADADSAFARSAHMHPQARHQIGEAETASEKHAPVQSGETGTAARIDLNAATARELETLPGIGPATAGSIIDWRETHGRFTTLEELLQVKGIGPKKFERIRDFLTIE